MAAKSFRCRLITPVAQVLDEQVVSAVIPAWDGLMGFLPDRAPIVAKLGLGELSLEFADSKGKGGSRSFLVEDGRVVSVGPAPGAGFLGVDYEPFFVQNPGQIPDNVTTAVGAPRYNRRLGLLDQLEDDFAGRGGKVVVDNHRRLYGKAAKLVRSESVKAFVRTDSPGATPNARSAVCKA